jgi:hypothetical protein
MRHLITIVIVSLAIAGCSNPKDIVLGSEPLKQMAEQGDQFKKLSEEDRTLLAGYLTLTEIGKMFSAQVKPATGRTVGEVLKDAHAWKEEMKVAELEIKKKEAEAEALKEKVLAERKAISQKISSSVTVAVTDTAVLSENRYSDMLSIKFAIENKSDKTIRQLKGRVIFKDAIGDKVGQLFVDFDEPVGAGKTLKTNTNSGWKINKYLTRDIEQIAAREFSSMKATFEPESIAFEGGEVLKAPELTR